MVPYGEICHWTAADSALDAASRSCPHDVHGDSQGFTCCRRDRVVHRGVDSDNQTLTDEALYDLQCRAVRVEILHTADETRGEAGREILREISPYSPRRIGPKARYVIPKWKGTTDITNLNFNTT